MLKNFNTNKKYIGLTYRPLNKRFNEHKQKAFDEDAPNYNSRLSQALRSDSQAFKIATIADNISYEDSKMVEAHYIDMYNTTNPEIGYNQSEGADHSFGDNKIDEEYVEPETDDISDEEMDSILTQLEGLD
jgi:epoxyqueuosine reductase QueG